MNVGLLMLIKYPFLKSYFNGAEIDSGREEIAKPELFDKRASHRLEDGRRITLGTILIFSETGELLCRVGYKKIKFLRCWVFRCPENVAGALLRLGPRTAEAHYVAELVEAGEKAELILYRPPWDELNIGSWYLKIKRECDRLIEGDPLVA